MSNSSKTRDTFKAFKKHPAMLFCSLIKNSHARRAEVGTSGGRGYSGFIRFLPKLTSLKLKSLDILKNSMMLEGAKT